MSEFRLREAANADGDAIRRVVGDALVEHGLALDPRGTDADLNDLERDYFAAGGWFAVLVDETGALGGTVGLHRVDADRIELRKMYLRPGWRGRGLGKRLLSAAIDRARAGGWKTIVLETNSRLKDAIAMYRRAGFRRVEGDHLASRCDQAWELAL